MAADPVQKDDMTAWERWELASFEEAGYRPKPAASRPKASHSLPTAEDIENIHREAHRQGFEEGRKEGHEAGQKTGYAEGQAKASGEANRLLRAAEKLEEALERVDQEVADELLALALEIARQVVRSEIGARPEILLNVVREALGQLPHHHVAIYLNPEDASLARSYLGDQLTHAGHRIHEDPKLKPGDCILEAGGSHIDATLSTRWQRVVAALGIESAWEENKGEE